ncbi:MAG: hypothetical protein ACRCWR_02525 [Saezia sp.]
MKTNQTDHDATCGRDNDGLTHLIDPFTGPLSGRILKARELQISPCELAQIRRFVETHHYSHNLNGVKISQCFRVKFEGKLVGGVVFGALSTTAWKRFADSEEKVMELRRLVLLDEAGRNSESRVVGWCLRWLKKHAPGQPSIG